MVLPSLLSVIAGTAPRGVRSESVEYVRGILDFNCKTREGDEVKMAVDEVGTGVGYVVCSSNASRLRLGGLGRAGEDVNGSKAGSREVAGLLEPGRGEPSVFDRVVEVAIECVLVRRPQRGSQYPAMGELRERVLGGGAARSNARVRS